MIRYSAARREGRSHRRRDEPCQDAFAVREVPGRGVVFAVADGLGSKPLSDVGSRVAAEAAIERLAREADWGVRAMLRSMRAARRAVRIEATRRGVPIDQLATTLQLGILAPGRAVAAMVGDGGFVAGGASGGQVDGPTVILAPAAGTYANEVLPVTSRWWRLGFEYAEHHDATWLAGFTDGLTRLLLDRQGAVWHPHAPFFEAFIPRLQGAADGIVDRFLDAEHVDASWDDDKCMVVAHASV